MQALSALASPLGLLPTNCLVFAAVLLTSAPASAAATPAYIPCNPGGGSAVLKSAPKHCTILPPSAAFASGVNLKSLDWKHWGAKHATFEGIELGFHLPPSHIPVHGNAYRLRASPCGGQMVYTRVKVTSRFGTTVVRPKACE